MFDSSGKAPGEACSTTALCVTNAMCSSNTCTCKTGYTTTATSCESEYTNMK
jgi:hypothetical protein